MSELIMSPDEFQAARNGSLSQRRLAHLHAALEAAGQQNLQMQDVMAQMQREANRRATLIAALVEQLGGDVAIEVTRLEILEKAGAGVKWERPEPGKLRLMLLIPEPQQPAPAPEA